MTRYTLSILAIALSLLLSGSLEAQPTPGELADQIETVNEERLAGIENLELTVQLEVGETMIEENTIRYVKTTRNGKPMLVADEESELYDGQNLMEGIFDGSMVKMVRGAESVEMERLGDKSAYKLDIRDRELLNMIGENELESGEIEWEIEKATLWIDQDMFAPLRMFYGEEDTKEGLSAEIVMDDYELHSGLPIAGTTVIDIKGVSNMISDEEIAEARQAMKQMREQLEQMPEFQRKMIESQMEGRMQQFEQMLESGKMGKTKITVLSVRVNS